VRKINDKIMEPAIDASTLALKDQQRLALIWEITQAVIAIALTAADIYVSVTGIVSEELSNAFFIIIGFYFGRLMTKGGAIDSKSL
jgi:hypothetical protein